MINDLPDGQTQYDEDDAAEAAALAKAELARKSFDRIWLQTQGDSMSEWYGEITWCQDKVHDDDVEYVNTRLYSELKHQRDELLAEVALIRHHLTELAKFADRAALVLVTIEAEDSTEGVLLQDIIDGIQTWAPDAIRGQIAAPLAPTSGV